MSSNKLTRAETKVTGLDWTGLDWAKRIDVGPIAAREEESVQQPQAVMQLN